MITVEETLVFVPTFWTFNKKSPFWFSSSPSLSELCYDFQRLTIVIHYNSLCIKRWTWINYFLILMCILTSFLDYSHITFACNQFRTLEKLICKGFKWIWYSIGCKVAQGGPNCQSPHFIYSHRRLFSILNISSSLSLLLYLLQHFLITPALFGLFPPSQEVVKLSIFTTSNVFTSEYPFSWSHFSLHVSLNTLYFALFSSFSRDNEEKVKKRSNLLQKVLSLLHFDSTSGDL